MSRLQKYATALGLAAALFVSSTALAAPQRDDSWTPGFISRIKAFVVTMLEEIVQARPSLPGG